MKMRRQGLSPVLLELVVVVLFFALAASILIQVLAAAEEESRKSALESEGMLALTDLCERIKAEPEGFGAFDPAGVCEYGEQDGLMHIFARIKRSDTGAGIYYSIDLTAAKDGEAAGTLSAGRYEGETEGAR